MRCLLRFSFFFLLILIASNTLAESWKEGKIVFLGEEREGVLNRPVVYIMNPDGSNIDKLTNCILQEKDKRIGLCSFSFSLSPDCKKVAFSAKNLDDILDIDIAVFDIDNHKIVNLTNGKLEVCMDPCWSPDGKKIVFCSNINSPTLYVINSDGTDIRKIGEGHNADWSADGQNIAFVKGNGDIYSMDANGGDVRQLEALNVQSVTLRYSPDSKRIPIYCHGFGIGDGRVYVMDSNGENLRLVKGSLNLGFGDCCWSPDGQGIAITARVDPDKFWYIWVMDSGGNNFERLTDNEGGEDGFDWKKPTFFAINPLSNSTIAVWGKIKTCQWVK